MSFATTWPDLLILPGRGCSFARLQFSRFASHGRLQEIICTQYRKGVFGERSNPHAIIRRFYEVSLQREWLAREVLEIAMVDFPYSKLETDMILRAIIFAASFVFFVQPAARAEESQRNDRTQKVVVHLSHFTDDVHRCFMALKMADLMQKHGAEVTIYLDLEGVRLAERRQLLDQTWGEDSPPLSEHYDNFVKAGGRLVLCPHCAKSARIGDGALKRNAEIATMPSLGKLLIDADKIMDY